MRADLAAFLVGPDLTPPWIIPGIICESSIVVWAGAPGAGKTSLAYSLAIAKATGCEWLGRPLTAEPILYFDEENGEADFKQYMRWYWRGLGMPDPARLNETLRFERFTLTMAGKLWVNLMRQIAQEHRPRLILLDTATPACHIENENDNSMASEAIRQLRQVQTAASPGCSIIVFKHAKLDKDEGKYIVRGAKAWVGETDATIIQYRGPGGKDRHGFHWNVLRPEKVRAFGLQGLLCTKLWETGPPDLRARGFDWKQLKGGEAIPDAANEGS